MHTRPDDIRVQRRLDCVAAMLVKKAQASETVRRMLRQAAVELREAQVSDTRRIRNLALEHNLTVEEAALLYREAPRKNGNTETEA